MKRLITLGYFFFFAFSFSFSQNALQSGPMVGYSTMKEVLVWVQTTGNYKVQCRYWEKDNSKTKFTSDPVQTEKTTGYTAKLICEVQQGKTYQYEILVNGKALKIDRNLEFQSQELWQYRKDPKDFKIAIGSCSYYNDSLTDRPVMQGRSPYGGDYQIYESIHQKDPDLMVWLGDNLYYREPDWDSWTGILYRNTYARSNPHLQNLLGDVHHYAIWDDHDFGPNDADGSFYLKDKTKKAFELFWGNTGYGVPGLEGGITSTFTWNDAQFFLLDNRYYRTANFRRTGERTVLGKDQLEWLINALRYSRAPFKFVCLGGQVLTTESKYETYESLAPEERKWLIETIRKERIPGVIFLNGDRHHTELTQYDADGFYPMYDITISPLTSGSYSAENNENQYRVKGTMTQQRNFGIMEITGPRTDRKLRLFVYDADGKQLWDHTIMANDLRYR